MKTKLFTSSCDWIAYFYENAQTAAALAKPRHNAEIPPHIREVVAGSLPGWQLGETSDGRHLRAAARQYAETHDDAAFLSAVELFIREEQRHGAALGTWLDLVGIPRKSRDVGDSLFRLCRYAIPNYAVWASVVVMVESMAEIYYTAVRRLVPCPRLHVECTRILRDEVQHIRFQCEHLASSRRRLPRLFRVALRITEGAFYGVVCTAVWITHGRLLRASGMPALEFVKESARKFRFMQRLMQPERYDFQAVSSRPVQPRRVRLPYAGMTR
ncbi:MAG: ferritin-like domain-containing protein [Chthoniobacterales bacterium]